MNEDTIRGYAKLMKELELTGLEITENNATIRLERECIQAVPAAQYIRQDVPSASAQSDHSDNGQEGLDKITSPMVGVFYAAPAENADPFVKVGDRIKKGDTVCIIEAMKLMNEVVSECDGVIKEICVSNAQTVEFGTTLFLIGE